MKALAIGACGVVTVIYKVFVFHIGLPHYNNNINEYFTFDAIFSLLKSKV